MTKSVIIILFIILSILLGCRFDNSNDDIDNVNKSKIKPDIKNDIRPDYGDTVITRHDNKFSLPELEETYPHFDYNSVIKAHSKHITDKMSVTKFKYFVVFSELDENLTYKIIDNDIRNTSDAMSGNYVNKLPDRITPVFLFGDHYNYIKFVLKNFDIPEHDISPYGFFKISKNVIVIRYLSWKGSIIHEITHRFVKSDFPDAPSWFDEGLSSLNEKSTFVNGNLIGDFSLRIIPLRRAIKENKYTGLRHLMETNDTEFYENNTSFYYAQARYLLMYLQQKGLLNRYYRHFRDNFSEDNTGIKQFQFITGKSIEEMENEYIDYIRSFDNY